MSTIAVSEKLATFIAPFAIPENSFQKEAYSDLMQLDFPTTKNEYWKYTRVGKIQNSKLHIQSATYLSLKDLNRFATMKNFVLIENGELRSVLVDPSLMGVSIESVKPEASEDLKKFNSAVNSHHIFTALNSTYFSEIISIKVKAKSEMKEPLHFVFISSGNNSFSNPRFLIEVEKSATAKFSAEFVTINGTNCFNNVIAEFFVGENASLNFDKIQNEASDSFHISTEEVVQEKNSKFSLNTFTLDGQLVRNNINILVNGENCESHMNAAIIAKENSHVDNHTFVDHAVANCFSNENYKYVLEDKATGVFNGRVIVRQHAQKINAYQKNANILLSDYAQINSKPELEIYADDVKCSHGSTTGQLDENAIFYLQARGISKKKAKKLLVSAFINEITEQFSSDEFKSIIQQELISKHHWTEE